MTLGEKIGDDVHQRTQAGIKLVLLQQGLSLETRCADQTGWNTGINTWTFSRESMTWAGRGHVIEAKGKSPVTYPWNLAARLGFCCQCLHPNTACIYLAYRLYCIWACNEKNGQVHLFSCLWDSVPDHFKTYFSFCCTTNTLFFLTDSIYHVDSSRTPLVLYTAGAQNAEQ